MHIVWVIAVVAVVAKITSWTWDLQYGPDRVHEEEQEGM
jgi:hypothetical protein